MKKNSSSTYSAFFNLRALVGFLFCFAGVLLALLAFGAFGVWDAEQPARYMPVPGSSPEAEAADLGRLEQYWNDRLTYPTGRFNPKWLRAAAAQHARLARGVPAGMPAIRNSLSPLALTGTAFIGLGPQPERMTGC